MPLQASYADAVDAVDAVFPIEGHYLPRDHGQVLWQSLRLQLPWLASEKQAGIHPIKLVSGNDSLALLSRRSCLVLRLARQRAPDLHALHGLDLLLDGQRIRLGAGHLRELQALGTLYAYKVAAESADEVAFMQGVQRRLAELAIGGESVCGKHQSMVFGGGTLNTFSLMLHALAPEQSLRLQRYGIGAHRLLGCGIFVPHKSAAAV